ncbi:hypothetical protein GCM10009847_17960 [Leucobacter tardus]|uniref:Camelysin metallo-endopeptidase n=1 Tax=Leucobacter tardus TaxID=501483 RepID=A0A939TNX8_9MICO|nr:hypothetical protein [Leucobacter tardus]MBO2990689.1 hypothetical protein [Leucobacter tardus]
MESTNTPRKSYRKRTAIAAGSLLGVAALITAAAFNDSAFLNFGNGNGGDGIGGGDNTFDIQVVDTAATTNLPLASSYADAETGKFWQQANKPGADGVTIGIPNAETMTPGDTISTSIPFKNDSKKLGGDLVFSLADSPKGTSSAVPAGETKSMADLLRYTVEVKDAAGTTTATYADLTQAGVDNLDLGEYDAGTGGTVSVSITWTTTGINDPNNYQGNSAYVQAQFVGTSV